MEISKRKKLSRNEFLERAGIGVNCTGYYSREMFNDHSLVAVKGHLVHADISAPKAEDGRFLNYVYESEVGQVYGFPKTEKVILGGSHLEGTPKIGGSWNGKTNSNTVRIKGKEIPEKIIDVNSELINNINGEEIRSNIQGVYSGYRPYRTDGVRIEKENIDGHLVLHNYGHGGAGVTLSWGTACEVANKLENNKEVENKDRITSNLQDLIEKSIRELNN